MSFLSNLREATNYTMTENGAITHASTMSYLYDMFAMGGAMRNRTDADIILMFKRAYEENPTYALKCLFYLRDILEGQGERRFFRVCMKWLAQEHTDAAQRVFDFIPEYGRYDDFFCLVDTPLETEMFETIKRQLALDVQCKTPSLLAKWLPSENASSVKTCALGKKVRTYLGMTARQYRLTLSELRKRINVLERLMSANKWDEIEFDKIPSKAGLKYRNAFARHDVERAKKQQQTYAEFMADKDTKVNAKALYPYEVVEQAINLIYSNYYGDFPEIERNAINKYWDNLTDYFKDKTFNGLAVVDTSASMRDRPLAVATSLGLYCAERAKGPFAEHYISFSARPQLIKTDGIDFVDKVKRIYDANLCENTNIEATFDLLLNTAINNNIPQNELPENLIIISDMEFDFQRTSYGCPTATLMENIENEWNMAGYKMPNLIYWNVNARQDNIPMKSKDGVTFVSGCSPVIFDMIMSGKTSQELMIDKLNSERYKDIK